MIVKYTKSKSKSKSVCLCHSTYHTQRSRTRYTEVRRLTSSTTSSKATHICDKLFPGLHVVDESMMGFLSWLYLLQREYPTEEGSIEAVDLDLS